MRFALFVSIFAFASMSHVVAGYLYTFNSASNSLPDLSGGNVVYEPFSFQYATPNRIASTVELSQSQLQNVVLPAGYHILAAAFEDPLNEGVYPFQPAIAFSFDQAPVIGGGQLTGFELENWSGKFSAPGVYTDNLGDTLVISSAPEPATLVLFPAGAAAAFLLARKRPCRDTARRRPNAIH